MITVVASSACGQILQKNPGMGQTPPPSRQCLYFGNFEPGNPSLKVPEHFWTAADELEKWNYSRFSDLTLFLWSRKFFMPLLSTTEDKKTSFIFPLLSLNLDLLRHFKTHISANSLRLAIIKSNVNETDMVKIKPSKMEVWGGVDWFHTSILFFQTPFKHTSNILQHPSNTLKTPINTLQTTFKIISFFRSKSGRKKNK